ncbi:hypothetical protein L2734_00075 [Parashewanella spongiae]|uniref:hypothetical protein n=1 Tax=Parashewanella spongiae TaxID=342950 RepID=UPI001404FCD8|nr:hypothetical protein [Parashewanella spongiae]MCL1076580.1 hypothetical protein [Parashewanella spongiae]
MINQTETNKQWLNSKETQRALKISGCQLMHLRESGKLQFKKVGRAYFYWVASKIN